MTPKIVMVGAGGYGRKYLRNLFERMDSGGIEVAGVVSSSGAKGNPDLEGILSRGIPIFRSLEEFCGAGTADLAIISSPIHLHLPHTETALAAGMNVLCEKPVCAVIQDAIRMRESEKASENFVAVGFDWSFASSIQALKSDILAGVFGRSIRLKSLVLWPRDHVYYSRNRWAGRIRDEEGNWVLDSPANNATAHYLHNMFYLLGGAVDGCAFPGTIEAELYRANEIENYDTCALRSTTRDGTEILFYATHAVTEARGPDFHFEFENATVEYRHAERGIRAVFRDGSRKDYGNPSRETPAMPKVGNCLDVMAGRAEVFCGIEAASAQVACINAAQETAEVTPFPGEIVAVREGEKTITFAEGLFETLEHCYDNDCLPAEAGVAWAKKPTPAKLGDYRAYPGLPG